MARTKGSHDIAPMIRGAFIRAAKSLEAKGKPLSVIIEDSLQDKPLETLKAISSFVPKEMLIEADITTQLDSMSDEALDAEIRRLANAAGIIISTASETDPTQH